MTDISTSGTFWNQRFGQGIFFNSQKVHCLALQATFLLDHFSHVPAMSSLISTCPFCGLHFKRLALHFPRCKERNDRDYSKFLPSKPVRSSSACGTCSMCGHHFKHLNTHRVSATCCDVAPTQPSSDRALPSMNFIPQTTAALANITPAHHFKHPLRLPRNPEEWDQANSILSAVAAASLEAISAEEKNSCLCGGIYEALANRFGTTDPKRHIYTKPKVKQHDRALKKVTQMKNDERRALNQAKRLGESASTIQSLSAKFLSLLRDHRQLKHNSSRRLQQKQTKLVREECHKNFWRYAKHLFEGKATHQISASTAHSFFSEAYKSTPHQFQTPPWMPAPLPTDPDKVMDMSPISAEELSQVIRRSRHTSAPSPFDRISYTILKRCPSLHIALLDLFNRVLMEGSIPSTWKVAAVKLIPKSSAEEDPSLPSNFRPIALTPADSKLFSGILKDKWMRHMKSDGFLNPDLQRAFLPTIPGVAEHQAKLAAIIRSARRDKRSQAVAWLDIANAYGSVHHSLIQFSLQHYQAPPQFCALMQSMYTGLSATISTEKWCTAPVPLHIGVYEGDPLSVAIFLTVINTLSDTLSTRHDLGFTLPSSSVTTNHLLYADDACVLSSSPAGCQHLLDLVQQWLDWAQLKAKIPKCRSMVIQASTGKRVRPRLSIGCKIIPPVEEDDSFKFLGMPIRIFKNNNTARSSLKNQLQKMLSAIDETPLTPQQKLRLFRLGICPRLLWPLLIEEFPFTWLERELQPLATRTLKRWVGLPRSSNTAVLFLPEKRGGLALPSLVSLHKKMQGTRMIQLLTSHDPGVRRAGYLQLAEERARQCLNFRPASRVNSTICQNQHLSLKRGVQTILQTEEVEERHK